MAMNPGQLIRLMLLACSFECAFECSAMEVFHARPEQPFQKSTVEKEIRFLQCNITAIREHQSSMQRFDECIRGVDPRPLSEARERIRKNECMFGKTNVCREVHAGM